MPLSKPSPTRGVGMKKSAVMLGDGHHHRPVDLEVEVNAEQMRSRDIELTSRKHLNQHLAVDDIEQYGDLGVLVLHVGHATARAVTRDRRVTVAR